MVTEKTLFWFRNDLRITDNPAFYSAVQGGAIMPIFILDTTDPIPLGAASTYWLRNSLSSLNDTLNGHLQVYQGDPAVILIQLCKEQGISHLYWNAGYTPHLTQKDTAIQALCLKNAIEAHVYASHLLWDPEDTVKSDGTPYKVFTPFYRNGCLKNEPPREPLSAPENWMCIEHSQSTHITLADILPAAPWESKLTGVWQIGENAGQKRLDDFLAEGLNGYKENRNYPARDGVSRLSPHLHFGEISIHQVWHKARAQTTKLPEEDLYCFLSELGWREFSYSLLYHFPKLPTKNFQEKFDAFDWKDDHTLLKAWQQGKTGYPIVDAGMRELWQTGYMHNRVRMIVGSFLVKNLRLHWHHGRDWFWDCLVDADLANNSASWQWIAGCGADAAPYFRIFNPVTQGEKFDPAGTYTRRFIPELVGLPDKFLFKPWEAPPELLLKAGIVLGKDYPRPIVDLGSTRKAALEAYRKISHQTLEE